jgi:hypothetical protein
MRTSGSVFSSSSVMLLPPRLVEGSPGLERSHDSRVYAGLATKPTGLDQCSGMTPEVFLDASRAESRTDSDRGLRPLTSSEVGVGSSTHQKRTSDLIGEAPPSVEGHEFGLADQFDAVYTVQSGLGQQRVHEAHTKTSPSICGINDHVKHNRQKNSVRNRTRKRNEAVVRGIDQAHDHLRPVDELLHRSSVSAGRPPLLMEQAD